MGTVVRAATRDDANGIASCVRAAYGHYVARIGKPPGPMLDDYAAVVRDSDVYVVEHAARVVAVLVMIARDGGVLLDNIAVHPGAAGAGLGRVLLDFAQARAAARGFAALDLYTHALMHENIAWYARRGFVETTRIREKGFDRVYMRKTLRLHGTRDAAGGRAAIRPAADADVPALLAVIRAAFAQYRGVLDPPSSAERKDPAVLRAELEAGGALAAVADGAMAGCVLWEPRGETLHFGRLSVLPAHRGDGIGGALVAAVEALARARGCDGTTLSVRVQLESQQRWYAARGYALRAYGTHAGYTRPTSMLLHKPLSMGAL